jgi:pilus assembly protein CpaF
MRIEQLLESYFTDPHLDEVLINGCDQALLLGASQNQRQTAASPFPIASDMIRICQQLAWSQNLRLDPMMPAAGGAIEASINNQRQQFRWHCLLPPVSRDGPLLSLRRHRLDKLTIDCFATERMQSLLARISLASGPLFIAGPTGAGKTSLMMALLRLQAADRRVAILEQTAELPRLEPGWIRLQAQNPDLEGRGAFSLSQGFDELLRLRPDRIVIGELRQREEVQAIRRAVLAGHGSVWATLHASSAGLLAARLADLAQEEERAWNLLLREQEAHVILMSRDAPRVKSVWQCGNEGWIEKTP